MIGCSELKIGSDVLNLGFKLRNSGIWHTKLGAIADFIKEPDIKKKFELFPSELFDIQYVRDLPEFAYAMWYARIEYLKVTSPKSKTKAPGISISPPISSGCHPSMKITHQTLRSMVVFIVLKMNKPHERRRLK